MQPEDLKDIHIGKRAFMVGNGPSMLKQLDTLPLLSDEITFVCNGWPNWKEQPFKPVYYGLTDVHPDIAPKMHWPESEFTRILIDFPKNNNHVELSEFIYFEKSDDANQMDVVGFKCLDGKLVQLPTGWATPITIMQVAAYMGIREFYLVGCDFNDHGYVFDPEGLGSWQLPNGIHTRAFTHRSAQGVQRCVTRARADIEKAGGSLTDCTIGGFLNRTAEGTFSSAPFKLLEYKELSDVLAG